MDIDVFSPRELPVALGALRAIDLSLTAPQERFLEVIARLHHAPLDPGRLPTPSLQETAAVITDPHRRKRLLQLAVVMTTIDGEARRPPTEYVLQLGRAMGVDDHATRTLGELAAHNRLLTRIDLTRHLMGRFLGDAWRDEKWSGVRKMVAPLLDVDEEPEVSLRYKKLGLLAPGTLGRELWEHCTVRGFPFPGEHGGIPERAVFHDVGHVLSGYDTDPNGEIQQAAFQSGFVGKDGFAFLFFGIVQFSSGREGLAEVGYLDVDMVMTALSRGASCNVDLSDHWNHWRYMSRPLEEVRRELGIPALAAA